MPVKRIQIGVARAGDEERLQTRLVAEWRGLCDTEPRPHIREELEREHVVHVYVVWSEWAELNQEVRANIIQSAFCSVYDAAAESHIRVAMGLTPEEARRNPMGLHMDL